MNAKKLFLNFNKTMKIAGVISSIIAISAGILILGIMLEQIQPNGSTVEVALRYFLKHTWIMIVLMVLSIYSSILIIIGK